MRNSITIILITIFISNPVLAVEMVDNDHIRILVDKRMQVIDKNNDGQASKDEFIAASEKKFADGDSDHNGFLSKQELLAMKLKEAKDLSVPEKK